MNIELSLDSIRVYIAASSEEVERAEYWTSQLAKRGIVTTSSWLEDAKSPLGCNRVSSTQEERLAAADDCQAGVENADLVWILMPSSHSMGAFWEFGFATACELATCVSGANQYKSVFSAKAKYTFETDEAAFDFITSTNMVQLYSDPS